MLGRLAQTELRLALANPRRYAGIAKANKVDKHVEELSRLLLIYGLRMAGDAASRTAGRTVLPATAMRDALAGKDVNIQWFEAISSGAGERAKSILESTKEAARRSVKRILLEAQDEVVQPSTAEVARRIRTAMRGPDVEREPREHATQGKTSLVFGFEHAMTIARTELAQAENTGIMAGYEASGVKRVEWQAYTDGRSGSRHHERMDGVIIEVGDVFRLPSGAKLRYPGDPLGPISETVNCRCTVGAVVT
jgi:hypothetical protein